MIECDEVINLVKTYFPDADNEIAPRIAEDVIRAIIPEIHADIRKAVSEEKSKTIIKT